MSNRPHQCPNCKHEISLVFPKRGLWIDEITVICSFCNKKTYAFRDDGTGSVLLGTISPWLAAGIVCIALALIIGITVYLMIRGII